MQLDNRLVNSIEMLDLDMFRAIMVSTQATVCGSKVIELLLTLLHSQRQSAYSYVTAYDRSSKQDKNVQHSVSYAAIAFCNVQREHLPLQDQLTGYEKNVLRSLVQSTLQKLFSKTQDDDCWSDEIVTMPLQQHRGAFVTLYEKGKQLRGCIGTVTSNQPLYATLCDMTKSAALHDTRFTSVTQSEINNLIFSISVLTQPRAVLSYHNIRLGIDGVVLQYNNKSSLFLPNVATEFGWDLTTMLTELSKKAGLAGDAWKNKQAQFEVFQTIEV
jgi:AmmeMemoRadiSam system protein A